MNFLQFQRYFVLVRTFLGPSLSANVIDQAAKIDTAIYLRLGLGKDAKIPQATRLNPHEMELYRSFCDWADRTSDRELCRNPQARVVAVNTILATLLSRLPAAKKLTDTHLVLVRAIADLDAELRAIQVTGGLGTQDQEALLPLVHDELLALTIDRMEASGVTLTPPPGK